MLTDLTVVIVTYQEEDNIEECIKSVSAVTDNIFVVDSFSTDATQSILREMQIEFCEYEFVSYADKRNWAQSNNPFSTPWIFHLDADIGGSTPVIVSLVLRPVVFCCHIGRLTS